MKILSKRWIFISSGLAIILFIFVIFFASQGNSSIRKLTDEELLDIRFNYSDEDRKHLDQIYGDTASYTGYFSVHDLISRSSIIVTAEYVGDGDTIGMGNGLIRIENRYIDDTAYYVETLFRIHDTYMGEDSDSIKMNLKADEKDNIITVLEYTGFGSEADKNNLVNKDGEYLLMLSEDQSNQLYVAPLYGINRVDEDGNILWSSKVLIEASKLEGITDLKRLRQAVNIMR